MNFQAAVQSFLVAAHAIVKSLQTLSQALIRSIGSVRFLLISGLHKGIDHRVIQLMDVIFRKPFVTDIAISLVKSLEAIGEMA